jgi:ligand-binding sensor domain-containing protein
MWILVLAAGCQEYGFAEPVDPLELPGLPPTVPPEVTPDPPPSPTPPPGVAVEEVYANTDDTLYVVDPVNLERTPLGTFRLPSGAPVQGGMTDIAIDNQGVMYGGTQTTLYRIDAQTAVATPLCDTPTESQMYAMAFTPDDRLIASGADGTIRVYDVQNCFAYVVLDDDQYDTSGDLVGLPDGFIYWTVDGLADGEDGLVRLDTENLTAGEWTTQYLGAIPYRGLFGLGYANGLLYGFSTHGITVTVEVPGPPPASGVLNTSTIENDEDIGWWGATTNPVAWD